MRWPIWITCLDGCFDHLAAEGLAANTMVLFVADHGEDLDGVHKLHRTDSYYQTAIAVPFFLPSCPSGSGSG